MPNMPNMPNVQSVLPASSLLPSANGLAPNPPASLGGRLVELVPANTHIADRNEPTIGGAALRILPTPLQAIETKKASTPQVMPTAQEEQAAKAKEASYRQAVELLAPAAEWKGIKEDALTLRGFMKSPLHNVTLKKIIDGVLIVAEVPAGKKVNQIVAEDLRDRRIGGFSMMQWRDCDGVVVDWMKNAEPSQKTAVAIEFNQWIEEVNELRALITPPGQKLMCVMEKSARERIEKNAEQTKEIAYCKAVELLESATKWKDITPNALKLERVEKSPIYDGTLRKIIGGVCVVSEVPSGSSEVQSIATELRNRTIGSFSVTQWRDCGEAVIKWLKHASSPEQKKVAAEFNQWVKDASGLQELIEVPVRRATPEELMPEPGARKTALSLLKPACNWADLRPGDITQQLSNQKRVQDIIAGLVVISKHGIGDVQTWVQKALATPIAGTTLEALGGGSHNISTWVENSLKCDLESVAHHLNGIAEAAKNLHEVLSSAVQGQVDGGAAGTGHGICVGARTALGFVDELLDAPDIPPLLSVKLNSQGINILHDAIRSGAITKEQIKGQVKTRGDLLLVQELALSQMQVGDSKQPPIARVLSSLTSAHAGTSNVNPTVLLEGLLGLGQELSSALIDQRDTHPIEFCLKQLRPYLNALSDEQCRIALNQLDGVCGEKISKMLALAQEPVSGKEAKLLKQHLNSTEMVLGYLTEALRARLGKAAPPSHKEPLAGFTPLESAAVTRIGADLKSEPPAVTQQEPRRAPEHASVRGARIALQQADKWKSIDGEGINRLVKLSFPISRPKTQRDNLLKHNGGGLSNIIEALAIVSEHGSDTERETAKRLLASTINGISVAAWGRLDKAAIKWIDNAEPKEREEVAGELNKLVGIAARFGAFEDARYVDHEEENR